MAGDALMQTGESGDLLRLLENATAAAGGFLGSRRGEQVKSVARIVQHGLRGRFAHGFSLEYQRMRDEGRIDEKAEASDAAQETLAELLDSLENDPPVKERFEALQRIYLATISGKFSNSEIQSKILMKLCRTMEAGEILMLIAAKTIGVVGKVGEPVAINKWREAIAAFSPLGLTDLVETFEEQLVNKRLLLPPQHPDKSGLKQSETGRLTPTGLRLMQLITFDPFSAKVKAPTGAQTRKP